VDVRSVAELRALRRELEERARGAPPPLERRLEVLAEVSARWRERSDPFRRLAVRGLVLETGVSAPSAEAGLDATLAAWTPRAWSALARRELAGRPGARAGVVPHVLGGALPGPNLLPLFLTLLAGGAPLARAGRRAPSLAALGLASVAAVDPDLGSRGAVCRWPREREDLLRALFAGAAVGSVTGGDAAVGAVRARVPRGTRLLVHPARTSVAAAGAAALAGSGVRRAARRIARDVTLHDQAGCLSPVGVLVLGPGVAAADALAASLAAELDRAERRRPRLRPDAAEAAALRAFHDAFAAAGRGRVHAGEGLAWIVGRLGPGEPPPPSPLLRSVWVLPVRDRAAAERALAPWRGRLAGLGVHGTAAERRTLRELGRALGARWLPRAGRLQSPPLAWRADGVRPLADLLDGPS
jgi:hypothetical protein